LTQRPRDVSALIDAVASGQILRNQMLRTDAVAVIGHSWGGTTVLQLAGADPTDRKMLSRCSDQEHPEGNMSWVLQCSWLSSIREAGAADPRVRAVVSVSPPLRLLFDPASSRSLGGKVLLISGTADWVVPSGPEAILPMRETKAARHGHRLVLFNRANHFTPRSFRGDPQPSAIGALLLAWLNEQLDVSGSVTFSGGGWGDPQQRLVDVSDRL
jgi:predicted dienelactone hydrolase